MLEHQGEKFILDFEPTITTAMFESYIQYEILEFTGFFLV